jgi:uncharacterized membrane protein
LLICGLIALTAATILTIEKIELYKNPSYQPTCDLSPLISCGSVMKTWQASAFGFPNSLIGVAGFAVVATLGATLLAGATFKRWLWRCVEGGVVFGMLFIFWLQYQSIYRIGALCPYCMVVWSMMIPLFWYVSLYNFREGHIKIPAKLNNFLQKHHGDILIVWYLVIAGLILNHFWYYWSTVL